MATGGCEVEDLLGETDTVNSMKADLKAESLQIPLVLGYYGRITGSDPKGVRRPVSIRKQSGSPVFTESILLQRIRSIPQDWAYMLDVRKPPVRTDMTWD